MEFQLKHQSFQRTPRSDLLYDGPVGSPCSPRDSQESSPTLQFKSINALVLSYLYSPTLTSIGGFPIVQMVKNLPVMQETRVQFLGQEDPLKKGMATHSSTLAWRIPWTKEPGGL